MSDLVKLTMIIKVVVLTIYNYVVNMLEILTGLVPFEVNNFGGIHTNDFCHQTDITIV